MLGMRWSLAIFSPLLILALNSGAQKKHGKKPSPKPKKEVVVDPTPIGTPLSETPAKTESTIASRPRLELPKACLNDQKNSKYDGKMYVFRAYPEAARDGEVQSMNVHFLANGKEIKINFNGTERIHIDLTRERKDGEGYAFGEMTLAETLNVFANYNSKELKEKGESPIPQQEADEIKTCLKALAEAKFVIEIETKEPKKN